MLLHAEHLPSCADCHTWMYDLKTGRRERRGGKDAPRAMSLPPPCFTCPKGPEPYVNEPTRRTLRIIDYARLCEVDTTGILPRDLLVVRNNAIVRLIERKRASTVAPGH